VSSLPGGRKVIKQALGVDWVEMAAMMIFSVSPYEALRLYFVLRVKIKSSCS
jgi:hypothetical protein